jgi:O-antigen ligase
VTTLALPRNSVPWLALLLGLVAIASPLLALAAAFGLLLAVLLARRPELALLAFTFLLISNAVVIGVRFHGVPHALGAAFPALLLIPIARAMLLERQAFVLPPATPWVLGFVAAQVLGTAFAHDVGIARALLIESLLEGVLLYFLTYAAVRNTADLGRVVWGLAIASLVMGGIPLLQQLTGGFTHDFGGFGQLSEASFRTSGGRQPRLAGPIGEMNRYSQIMLVLVPPCVFLAWRERTPMRRGLALAACVTALAGFVLAFSRGGAVAFVLLFALAACMRLVRPKQVLAVALTAAVLLVAVPQYRTRLVTIPGVATLIGQPEPLKRDGAIRGRTTQMLAAGLVFLDYPLVGSGPGGFKQLSQEYGNSLSIRRLKEPRQAHSLPLHIAADHGLLGSVAFGGLLVVTLAQLMRARRRWLGRCPERAGLLTAILLAFLAYLTAGLFLHLSYVRYFWFLAALAAAAPHAVEDRSGAREVAA